MGPHSFKCGKKGSPAEIWEDMKSLQWGRTLSSAERSQGSACRLPFLPCFNGAALFQVRKARRLGDFAPSACGFNGAALFQVRKEVHQETTSRNSHGLQWGRTLSSAESLLSIGLWKSPVRLASMGPHSFKCGKLGEATKRREAWRGLQWGRTLSSAES